jgi:hypothetical protein
MKYQDLIYFCYEWDSDSKKNSAALYLIINLKTNIKWKYIQTTTSSLRTSQTKW